MKKIKISIIDFLPENGKHKTGHTDINGSELFLGDMVKLHDENWFVAYRYGNYMLKQIGQMAMIGLPAKVEKLNQIGAGMDWLIIGYDNEPLFENLAKFL